MTPLALRLSVSRVYLVPCADGYLQIDTGYERDYSLYRRRLAAARIPMQRIRYLFLTHHHDDHAGFLNRLTADASVTIIAHREAGPLLQTGKNDTSRGGGYVNWRIKWLADLKMRLDPGWTLSFPPFTLRAGDVLVDADDSGLLPSLGVAGRILTTPGHCIDHLALVMESGEAFCGDAASSFLLWAGTRYCTLFMTDMDEAYHSWDKLLCAGASTIYPAHGKPFPAARLRRHWGEIATGKLVPLTFGGRGRPPGRA